MPEDGHSTPISTKRFTTMHTNGSNVDRGTTWRRIAGIVAIGAAAVAFSACSVTSSGPDGSSSVDVNVSLPDVSLPSLDSGGGGSSGGDSGGDNSGNSGGGDSGNSNNGGNGGNTGSSGSNNSGGNASTSATNDGLSPLAWAVIIIGVIAAIALIAGSSSSEDRQARADSRRRNQFRRINGVIQNSRWASSQASTALTLDDAQSLQSAWTQARTYLPDIETTAASIATDVDDSELASAVGNVGQTVASLRGAMDSYVNTRVHHARDDATARAAEQSVRQALASVDHSVQQLSDLTISRGSAS